MNLALGLDETTGLSPWESPHDGSHRTRTASAPPASPPG